MAIVAILEAEILGFLYFLFYLIFSSSSCVWKKIKMLLIVSIINRFFLFKKRISTVADLDKGVKVCVLNTRPDNSNVRPKKVGRDFEIFV